MSEVRAYQWDPQADTADAEYERVLQLHRENRSTLGHLPYAAFEEAGRRGQIIVGVVDGDLHLEAFYELIDRVDDVIVNCHPRAPARIVLMLLVLFFAIGPRNRPVDVENQKGVLNKGRCVQLRAPCN